MILLTSPVQTACQQELNEVLEEISRMTSEDNRGPLENLYRLKFPNCDKDGLYSLKQVSHAQHTKPVPKSTHNVFCSTFFIGKSLFL